MEKVTVEEANLQLVTKKAKLEKAKAKADTDLEHTLFVYKHYLTQGAQWQDSCTRQNHFIFDMSVKMRRLFTYEQKASIEKLVAKSGIRLNSIENCSSNDRKSIANTVTVQARGKHPLQPMSKPLLLMP